MSMTTEKQPADPQELQEIIQKPFIYSMTEFLDMT